MNRPPMAVRVPLEGWAHIVYAWPEVPVETTSLCGIELDIETVRAWPKARGLPVCGACDGEDLRRFPDRASRIFR